MRSARQARQARPIARFWLLSAACTMLVWATALAAPAAAAAAAALPRSGGSCPIRSIGAVAGDAQGQPLVCTKTSKTKAQWKLPALGSFLRPIPLGQPSAAGPAANRFNVRVTLVNFDAAAEIAAAEAYATPPPPGAQDVRVEVEATFLGPAATGVTGHYWYARDADGVMYASSSGCSGGYGTSFDVAAVVSIGGVVKGTHCFEVPSAGVAALRLRVEGSDRSDTYFALR